MEVESIMMLDVNSIMQQEVYDDVFSSNDPIEIAFLTEALKSRAKELGKANAVGDVIKAYQKALKKLEEENSKKFAEKHTDLPLRFDGKGMPMITIENFMLVFERDEKYKDKLQFNLLSNSVEYLDKGERKSWDASMDSEARAYIESKYNLYNPSKTEDALVVQSKKQAYHPVKNLIESIQWDGVERLETILSKWLKCDDTPYSREVARLIFAGGINRLYRPGCKFDYMPVLIGTKQGEGKSTFVQWLALKDDYFTEVVEIDGQRGVEAIEGAWICEVGELLAMFRSKDAEGVKSYLTRTKDKYRKPYDRHISEYQRQCIFIGTTNKRQFLADKTGNRRFLPLEVFSSGRDLYDNAELIKEEIAQCWAEALFKFKQGKMSVVADKVVQLDIESEQDSATEDDYREGLIAEYLKNQDKTCVIDLWENALGNALLKPSKRDSMEIGLIMQKLDGWERPKSNIRVGKYGIQKGWVRVSR